MHEAQTIKAAYAILKYYILKIQKYRYPANHFFFSRNSKIKYLFITNKYFIKFYFSSDNFVLKYYYYYCNTVIKTKPCML